jgi:glycosyltransferase involved in cell wall biosynthesis
MGFSVIIPTMFRCTDITNNLLASLYEDSAVSEVIIIDNREDYNTDIKIINHDKLKVYSQGKNIYVNAAWNLGVSISKEDTIALLNDDITIPEQIFTTLSQAKIETMGVIGACHPSIQEVENPKRFIISKFTLVDIPERTWGFGIFMIMKKNHYIPIPEDMKVWCGDDYLYHQNRIAGRLNYLMTFPIQTRMSTTSNDPAFDEIKNKDVEIYNSKYKV